MRRLMVLAALILFASIPVVTAAPAPAPTAATTTAAFGANCEKLLKKQLDAAEQEILVAIYTMTRKSIADALVRAAKRGVTVQVKYDGDQKSAIKTMKKAIDRLKKHKIKCTAIYMKNKMASMHHKFVVIDKKIVATGSYNYTTSASRSNYENLVVIESEKIASQFAEEFKKLRRK